MSDYSRSNRRVPNYHMRNHHSYTEPAQQPNYQNHLPSRITYDVNERATNLQKQQNYRKMLDEQVNDRNRRQMQVASYSNTRPHYHTEEFDREPPLTAYTDAIPYSPYTKESVDLQFKRELELNREREIQEMNQIRRDITHQLQAVKVFDYGSVIPEEEKLGFSRYYSQHQRPKDSGRSQLSPYQHPLKRDDSGRIEACLNECEAILNGFVEQTQSAYQYSGKKYNTVEHDSRKRRIQTEAIGGSNSIAKYDSINPNLFRLPELPIKKRPHYNGDIAPQLIYPKRTNILKSEDYNKAKNAVGKSRDARLNSEVPHDTDKLQINSYPRPKINLIEEHKRSGSEFNDDEQQDRNEFLAVKPEEPFTSNINVPNNKKLIERKQPTKPQPNHKEEELQSQPSQQLLKTESDAPAVDNYLDASINANNQPRKNEPDTKPTLQPLVMPTTESPPSEARDSRMSNNSALKLQRVPMTPRNKSKQSNHEDTKSEQVKSQQKANVHVESSSAIHFNNAGDTTSTMQLPAWKPEDDEVGDSNITINNKDIVSYLMRVKARGSKLFQRIKEHKEALKHVHKQESTELEASPQANPL